MYYMYCCYYLYLSSVYKVLFEDVERKRRMGFAELLEEAGGFGRYQWLHVTLISLPGLMMASQNLLNNFVSGSPAHHCSLPTNHSSRYNLSHYQVDEKQLLKAFIPMDSSGSRLDRCRRFVEPQWQLLAANSSANVSQIPTEGCLDGWAYDRSEFLSTTVSEWDLVCGLRPLKQMIQTIYMGGVLTGAIVYGGAGQTDCVLRYGRRSVLIWSYLQLGVLGCSSAFLPSYSTYCAFRFLSGMAVSGVILNGFSLSTVEWIPTKQRTLVGTLTSFFFTFGQMILAGLAYWLRDWRKLQLVVCLPQFLFFSYSCTLSTNMQTVRTTLACLGKCFTSASFTTVYLYTGELYPTVLSALTNHTDPEPPNALTNHTDPDPPKRSLTNHTDPDPPQLSD
ncbi:solute carrier family 22 member 6-B-like [Trematomus bernacchii]|uniref:solute carrier family 22 member 6-B-like n=1 Tax=Trematomus bernacchii TaxID=40690 RepID=UPI00146F1838|nr:solute carrier family 22 member 6-B-like [Trematomus bernacchii]